MMNKLKLMFGFIFTQPIYKTLQQMRVIHITALFVIYNWTDELLNKIPPLADDASAIMLGIYFTNFITLAGLFWTAIKDMRKPHE